MLIDRHIRILERRGLDPEMVARLGWSSSDQGGGDQEWLAIPYFRDGEVVNTKFRTIAGEKRFYQDKEGIKCFYNEDVLTDDTLADQPLIITEGEIDAAIAMQCGFPRTMSVPDGAPKVAVGADESGAKYSYVRDAFDRLKGIRPIILSVDGDDKGENLLHDLAIRLGTGRCKFVTYPRARDPDRRGRDRLKDLAEVYEDYGERGVRETLGRAQWMKVDGVYRMSELPPMPDLPKTLPGIRGLERHWKIRRGDFTVITGTPGAGKTTLLNDILCRIAWTEGKKIGIASFEQTPARDMRRNLRTWFNKKLVKNQTSDEIRRADEWIDRHFAFIVPDDEDDVTLAWTLEKCAAAIIQHDCEIIVIDPWNEMDHAKPPEVTLTEYVGMAIKEMKRFARRYQVALMIVAHPAKLRRDRDGNFPTPTLYDISDSAHFANKADVGVVIHRPEPERTMIRIAKSRYWDEIGIPGDFMVKYNPESCRFEPDQYQPIQGLVINSGSPGSSADDQQED